MSGPDASPLRRLHRPLEHDTPDGTLGRLLLGVPLLALAPALFFGGFAMFTGATSFPVFVSGLASARPARSQASLKRRCQWWPHLRSATCTYASNEA